MSSWKRVADSGSNVSDSSIRKDKFLKYAPQKGGKEHQSIFTSMIQNSRSRIDNNSLVEDTSNRGKSYSKDNHLHHEKLHKHSSVDVRIPRQLSEKAGDSKLKRIQVGQFPFSVCQELERLKNDFKKFHQQIMGELERQQSMIEKVVKQIVDRLSSINPTMPAIDIKLSKMSNILSAPNPKKTFASPPKLSDKIQTEINKKLIMNHKQIANETNFKNFDQAIQKLRHEIKGLSAIDIVSEGRQLRHVRSDPQLNR